jgi:hypothetical protein
MMAVPGMTLREHYAGLAMQGLLAYGYAPGQYTANMAGAMADYMLVPQEETK